jgi:integrase
VPVPPALYRRLRRYADRGRPAETHSDRLFLALRRNPLGKFDALTTSGVSQVLRLLAVAAGIKKRVHPHLLRHLFATWALTRWMNPLTLAQILGHSSLVMIQNVYAHMTPAASYDALIKVFADEWWASRGDHGRQEDAPQTDPARPHHGAALRCPTGPRVALVPREFAILHQ